MGWWPAQRRHAYDSAGVSSSSASTLRSSSSMLPPPPLSRTASPAAPPKDGVPSRGRQSHEKCRRLRSLLCDPSSIKMPGRAPGEGASCRRSASFVTCSSTSLALVAVLWLCGVRRSSQGRGDRLLLVSPPRAQSSPLASLSCAHACPLAMSGQVTTTRSYMGWGGSGSGGGCGKRRCPAALAVLCPRRASFGTRPASATATLSCSCFHAALRRRSLLRFAAEVPSRSTYIDHWSFREKRTHRQGTLEEVVVVVVVAWVWWWWWRWRRGCGVGVVPQDSRSATPNLKSTAQTWSTNSRNSFNCCPLASSRASTAWKA